MSQIQPRRRFQFGGADGTDYNDEGGVGLPAPAAVPSLTPAPVGPAAGPRGLAETDPQYQSAYDSWIRKGYDPQMARAFTRATGFGSSGLESSVPPPTTAPPPAPAGSPAPLAPETETTGYGKSPKTHMRSSSIDPATGKKKPAETQQGLFSNIQQPWLRALLTGGLGAMLGGAGTSSVGGGFGIGALGSGTLAGLLSLLMKQKKKPMDEDLSNEDSGNARGGRIKEGSSTMRSKIPHGRKMRFQAGGVAPPTLGAAPGWPGAIANPSASNPVVNPAMQQTLRAPMAPPALTPPAPPMAAPAAPPGGVPMPPGVTAPVSMPTPAPATGIGSLNALQQALPRTRPYRKGGAVDKGSGVVDDGSETIAKKRRPDRQWGETEKDLENKAPDLKLKKGGGVKVRKPKGPKVSIAVVSKKPVSTPSPYDYEADEGTAPSPGPGPAAAPAAAPPPGMNKGGKMACDKMAAGGVAKVRKGFPNTNKAPGKKKFAKGGSVRGCGAAKRGCSFSGIY
jgi:hypothetical protein